MSLRDQLQELYDEHGRLTPAIVVEAARPRRHPLHGYVFDRPPKEAAEAWYLGRAHDLIQSVKVVYAPAGEHGRARKVRKWQAVRLEHGYSYEPAEKVAADPFLRELLLRDAEREWKQMYGRYREFEEFIELVQATLEQEAA